MKFYLTIIALILSSTIALAQESAPFTTSRPGQAFTPLTMGKGGLQVQSGFRIGENYSTVTDFGRRLFYSASFGNTTTVRYGISEKVEIRAEADWSRNYENLFDGPERRFGDSFQRVSIGSRILLVNDDEKSQYFSVQPRLDLPIVDVENVGMQILLAYSKSVFSTATFTTNVSWTGGTAYYVGNQWDYALNLGFSITDNLSGFVENYGTLIADQLFLSFDTGLALMVSPNLQLDLSGGFGQIEGVLTLSARQWFVDTGVSWRIFDRPSRKG
ncbi:MAG: transporter [Bacteroidota bacterium]